MPGPMSNPARQNLPRTAEGRRALLEKRKLFTGKTAAKRAREKEKHLAR